MRRLLMVSSGVLVVALGSPVAAQVLQERPPSTVESRERQNEHVRLQSGLRVREANLEAIRGQVYRHVGRVSDDRLAEAIGEALRSGRSAENRLASVQRNVARRDGSAAEVARHLGEVRSAIAANDFEGAAGPVNRALEAQRSLPDASAEDTAEMLALAGDIEVANFRYRAAAALYLEAAERTPPGDVVGRGRHLTSSAQALCRYGALTNDRGTLSEAIDLYRERITPLAAQSGDGSIMAGTWTNLGNALESFGGISRSDAGALALRDAVAAHRDALVQRLASGSRVEVGKARSNLALALVSWSDRLPETAAFAALGEAISLYRAALIDLESDDLSVERATVQNNLGIALATDAGRRIRILALGPLLEARQTLDASAALRCGGGRPFECAATRNNLGAVLSHLGEYTPGDAGLALLDEAIVTLDQALEVRTEAGTPADWATTQTNLGAVYTLRAQRFQGEARLTAIRHSIDAYELALRVRTEASAAPGWAATTENLCRSRELRAVQTRAAADAAAVVDCLTGVIRVYQAMPAPDRLERAIRNRSRMVAFCQELGTTCGV